MRLFVIIFLPNPSAEKTELKVVDRRKKKKKGRSKSGGSQRPQKVFSTFKND